MKKAIIYKQIKSAVQSGMKNTHAWILEFINYESRYINPLTGWTANIDTEVMEVKLMFNSKEKAIEYISKRNIVYEVIDNDMEDANTKIIRKNKRKRTYVDNYTN